MTDVLPMAALQVRYPVPNLVEMESDDGSLHRAMLAHFILPDRDPMVLGIRR